MAVYNGQQWVKRQLDSIAAQTKKPDEVVIRLDGCSDDSESVIRSWMHRHPEIPVRLIVSEVNEGYRANFRHLLEEAKGDWIFLSDQDDEWIPEKIAVMMETVNAHPEIGLLASSFVFIDQNSSVFEVPGLPGYSNNNLIPWQIEHPGGVNFIGLEKMFLHNYFQGCAMALRKEIAEEYLRFDENILPHDWNLAAAAAAHHQLAYLDVPLFRYRMHGGNTIGLPEAHASRLERLKAATASESVRTIDAKQSIAALELVKAQYPEQWNADEASSLDFSKRYLEAVRRRKLWALVRLGFHPARKKMVRNGAYAASLLYVLKTKFVRNQKEGETA